MCNLGNLCFTICAECKFIALILTTNPRTCVAWKLIIMVHCLVNAYTVCVVFLWLTVSSTCGLWIATHPLHYKYPRQKTLSSPCSSCFAERHTLLSLCQFVSFALCGALTQHLYWSSSFPFRTDFFSRSCCFLMSLLCWTFFQASVQVLMLETGWIWDLSVFLCWLWSPLLSWCGYLNKLQLIFMNNTDDFSQTTYGK